MYLKKSIHLQIGCDSWRFCSFSVTVQQPCVHTEPAENHHPLGPPTVRPEPGLFADFPAGGVGHHLRAPSQRGSCCLWPDGDQQSVSLRSASGRPEQCDRDWGDCWQHSGGHLQGDSPPDKVPWWNAKWHSYQQGGPGFSTTIRKDVIKNCIVHTLLLIIVIKDHRSRLFRVFFSLYI